MIRRPLDRDTVIGIAARKSNRRSLALCCGGLVAAALLLAQATTARADDADFVKSKKCMNCHALDEKRVGPPFTSIAARYANDKEAEGRLAKKIREGGSGAWGVVPMPMNPEVDASESIRLARWVLMQKK